MDTDWQNKLTNLLQRINYLLESELFCDCEFIVSDKKIRCHQLILAASSPVFQTMFYGSMSTREHPVAPIHVTDINYEIFSQMISCIYSNDMKLSSCMNACDLYQAAKKYMLQDLVKKCLSYLGENLDSSCVLQLYEFAKFHSEKILEKQCLKEIQRNTSKVLKSEALKDVSESTLCTIVEMEILNTSEVELIAAVESWANAEDEKRGNDNLRLAAKNLVKKLRFLTLTVEEFISGPVKSKLLNDSEKLGILLKIINPELLPMRNSLCEKKMKRKQPKIRSIAVLDIRGVHKARCDGTEWLTSVFTTNSRIDLLGVELHLQVNETDGYYMENLMVKVSLSCEKVHFTEAGLHEDLVRYNSKTEIIFDEVTTLEPFTEYAIHVFLCSTGIYPLGKHSNLACHNLNVEIEFVSHSSWERSYPCNTTILNAIIYSDPEDEIL